MPVVFPANDGRQRHQDRLGAAARLQSEQGAPVVHQIEFHVSAAAVQLELAFAIAVRLVLAPFQQGQECGQKVIANAALKCKATTKAAVVQIVEEQSADAAGFVSMRQEKIAVAPSLIFLVSVRPERLTGVARATMPMEHILIVW